jgi:hypothetical protein
MRGQPEVCTTDKRRAAGSSISGFAAGVPYRPPDFTHACSHNGQRRQPSASTLIRSSGPDDFFFFAGFDFDFITPRSRQVQ